MENTVNNPNPTADITVADLEILKNVIDLASSRGAFRGGELKDVGELYNKLARFIDAVTAQAKAQAADASTEVTDTPTQGE